MGRTLSPADAPYLVVFAFKADGARPRLKIQHIMRSDTKGKEHKRLDHRARSVPRRRSWRKRSAELFSEAGWPKNSRSWSSGEAKRAQEPCPREQWWGRPVPRGPRFWSRGLQCPLPRIKWHCFSGRDTWPIDFWVSLDL